MIRAILNRRTDEPLTVLCLGAHSDDIEIGCGGTLLSIAREYPAASFHWVVFSAIGIREAEARRSANAFVTATALRGPLLKTFRDGFLPYSGAEVKEVFEELKRSVNPDLIFTTSRVDAHQDHRLVGELTWNTFRDHLILEYEIPKYDGDLGTPSLFRQLDADVVDTKVKYIMDNFQSQQSKHWFEESTFLSMMRLRGMECNSPSGYAEAFYARKFVL
jgi:LmbE family N-acetylglucosaminyl deacetylase